MRSINEIKTANFQKPGKNEFICDYAGKSSFDGILDKTIRFIEDFQLKNPVLWKRFVNQFREQTDGDDAGWRGEYWGKMMRGACFTYSYTRDKELYDILTETVRDMISSKDKLGRISTYALDKEFIGWDIWSRKYVMLGLQYYIEISSDEKLIEEAVECMCGQADYIMSKIGPKEDGKKPITEATNHWRGLNSASLLEPVVRLYNITGEKKYFEFAEYIAGTGATSVANIFELAYKNEFKPYQYPVTKAYEMTSCFEGLLELYRITGIEWYKTALINYADRILECDFTVIGSSGCTHELFDHSTARQANTTNEKIMQETCVTVTLMKFFWQLTMLTGNSSYADAFEVSLYNAYLGAVNTEKSIEPTIRETYPDAEIEPLPFDSYSPLTAGTRGNGIGGLKLMPDKHYYGCCACIGSAGTGLISKMALMRSSDGFVINLYIPGAIETISPAGKKILFKTETDYPKGGLIKIRVEPEAGERFTVKLRNPGWSEKTKLSVNGEAVTAGGGYIALCRQSSAGDVIELELDMSCHAVYPVPYGHEILMNHVIWGHNYMVATYDHEDPLACKHISLRRGPITLAIDSRLGYDAAAPADIRVNRDGLVDAVFPECDKATFEHMLELCVPLNGGGSIHLTDYASAGKLWTKESKIAAWIRTKE